MKVREGLYACQGNFSGLIGENGDDSAERVCAVGHHVCKGFGSPDFEIISTGQSEQAVLSLTLSVTFDDATSFMGCFVYDSASDCDQCHTSCRYGYQDEGSCLTPSVRHCASKRRYLTVSQRLDPDLSAMGHDCHDLLRDHVSCLADGDKRAIQCLS